MEITLQPLINSFKGKKFLFKLFQNRDGNYVLEIGTQVKPRKISQKRYEVISGNENVVPEITYTITDENYIKTGSSNIISRRDQDFIEGQVKEIYEFRKSHHVTEWKD